MPKLVSKDEIEKFNDKIRKTIKPIYHLQKDASDFMEKALKKDGRLRNQLPLPLKEEFDKMHDFNLIQQRWSDGLVFLVSLQQGKFECPIGGIFHLLGNIGSLCFLGLCKKSPLRGSVDISWGVELHPGEIYGAAVANAYEFESEVAQYPRIVVGERVVTYLEANIKNPKSDVFSEFNRWLSHICLGMIDVDFDGHYFVDYLGPTFKEFITDKRHKELSELALKFIVEQVLFFREKQNTKLAMRYNHLLSYFHASMDTSAK